MRPRNISRLEWYWLRHWWGFRYSWLDAESWSDWWNYWPNQVAVSYGFAALCFAVAGIAFLFLMTS